MSIHHDWQIGSALELEVGSYMAHGGALVEVFRRGGCGTRDVETSRLLYESNCEFSSSREVQELILQ
jgi:hypothetical protein